MRRSFLLDEECAGRTFVNYSAKKGNKTVTTKWHAIKNLSEILQEMTVRRLVLHFDIESIYFKQGLQSCSSTIKKQIIIEHSPCSPDLHICVIMGNKHLQLG